MMQTIIPHLWFDTQAREAAAFYTGLFENSSIDDTNILEDTPSGDVEHVSFTLAGQPFEAISAGPMFRFNPSVSLMVACRTAQEVDRLATALADGGMELMPLGEYPFSPRYAWVQDRYGLSWQLMLAQGEPAAQRITPNLLFSAAQTGKAEEAVRFYVSVFADSEVGLISRYAEGEADSPLAKVNYAAFRLMGQSLSAMDNGYDVDYTFSEAFSLIVYCDTQAEIDRYWEQLSRVPEAEACGWLKDAYGLSWQIVPRSLGDWMTSGDEAASQRVTAAFMQMKKLDIETLKTAFEGR